MDQVDVYGASEVGVGASREVRVVREGQVQADLGTLQVLLEAGIVGALEAILEVAGVAHGREVVVPGVVHREAGDVDVLLVLDLVDLLIVGGLGILVVIEQVAGVVLDLVAVAHQVEIRVPALVEDLTEEQGIFTEQGVQEAAVVLDEVLGEDLDAALELPARARVVLDPEDGHGRGRGDRLHGAVLRGHRLEVGEVLLEGEHVGHGLFTEVRVEEVVGRLVEELLGGQAEHLPAVGRVVGVDQVALRGDLGGGGRADHVGELQDLAGGHVVGVDVEDAVGVGREVDLAVLVPVGVELFPLVLHDGLQARAIGVDDVQVLLVVLEDREDDLLAVGRPVRGLQPGAIAERGQVLLVGAVEVDRHQVEHAVGELEEGDLLAIGADARVGATLRVGDGRPLRVHHRCAEDGLAGPGLEVALRLLVDAERLHLPGVELLPVVAVALEADAGPLQRPRMLVLPAAQHDLVGAGDEVPAVLEVGPGEVGAQQPVLFGPLGVGGLLAGEGPDLVLLQLLHADVRVVQDSEVLAVRADPWLPLVGARSLQGRAPLALQESLGLALLEPVGLGVVAVPGVAGLGVGVVPLLGPVDVEHLTTDDLSAGLHPVVLGVVPLGHVVAPVPVEGLGVDAEDVLDDGLEGGTPATPVLDGEGGVGLVTEALPQVHAEAVALLVVALGVVPLPRPALAGTGVPLLVAKELVLEDRHADVLVAAGRPPVVAGVVGPVLGAALGPEDRVAVVDEELDAGVDVGHAVLVEAAGQDALHALRVGRVGLERDDVGELVHEDVADPLHAATRAVEGATRVAGDLDPVPRGDGEALEGVTVVEQDDVDLFLEVVVELLTHRLPGFFSNLGHLPC